MDSHESEKTIIHRILEGEPDLYSVLIKTYTLPIYNLAFRLTGSTPDAEDLTQDILIKAFQSLSRFNPNKHFFPWLYAIAINTIRTHTGKKNYRRENSTISATSIQDPAINPEQRVTNYQERDTLTLALQKIPLDLREAVLLRYYQELSFDEVSEILGISKSAAKMRVYRALEQLEKLLTTG